MQRQHRVVLIGDSLLMDGVAANFKENPTLSVIRVEPKVVAMEDCIESIAPDAIVFDLDVVEADSVLCLLKNQPDIHLVGIDSRCSRMLVLNSCKHITPRMLDLIRLVESRVRDTTKSQG